MSSKKPINYRELSSELDTILGRLQTEELDIDDAMKKYERGVAIVAELEAYLQQAENKIVKIKKALK